MNELKAALYPDPGPPEAPVSGPGPPQPCPRPRPPAALWPALAPLPRVSSAVSHTGRPLLLRRSVCVPGDAALLFSSKQRKVRGSCVNIQGSSGEVGR